ncbi:hypothetical protein [Chitinophaga dinghuensis]|nr:hypothetical protein [Chitinophaga dinghuensis]
MKTLLMLLSAMAISCAAMAQTTVIKVPPPEEPMTDSIVYDGENVTIIINRVFLMDYLNTMDTSLPRQQYSGRAFNHVSFKNFTKAEMATHFQKAYCYLADTTHKDLSFSATKMYMQWAEDEGILLPYLECIMADLLQQAKLKVIEKFVKPQLPVTSYKMIMEVVPGADFRAFRLNNGKQIFRESTYAVEQKLSPLYSRSR